MEHSRLAWMPLLSALLLVGAPAAAEEEKGLLVGPDNFGRICYAVEQSVSAENNFGVASRHNLVCPRTDSGAQGEKDAGEFSNSAIMSVDAPGGGTALAKAYALRDNKWRRSLLRYYECSDTPPRIATRFFPQTETVILTCKSRRYGVDYLAMAAALNDKVYLMQGPPHMLQPLVYGAGLLSRVMTRDDALARQRQENATWPIANAFPSYSVSALVKASRSQEDAQLAARRNDFQAALDGYRFALDELNSACRDKVDLKASCASARAELILEIALQLSNLERFRLADDSFAAARDILKSVTTPRLLMKEQTYLANHAANQQRFDDTDGANNALQLVSKALKIGVEAGAGDAQFCQGGGSVGDEDSESRETNRRLCADLSVAYRTAAGAYLAKGDRAKSLQAFQQAYELLEKAKVATDKIAGALYLRDLATNWARALTADGRAQEALVRLEAAQAKVEVAKKGNETIRSGSRVDVLAQLARAEALSALGEKKAAFAQYDAAFALAAEIDARGEVMRVEPDRLERYFETVLDNQGAADAARRNRLFFEQAQFIGWSNAADELDERARVLEDAGKLADYESFKSAKRDAERVESELIQTSSAIGAGKDASEVLERKLKLLEERYKGALDVYAAAEKKLQEKFGAYFEVSSRRTEASKVQEKLRPDESLIQIIQSDNFSIGLLVRPDSITPFRIAATRGEIGTAVTSLRASTADVQSKSFDAPTAHYLYASLFAPIAAQLPADGELIISATDILLSLPFSLLIEPPTPPGPAAAIPAESWFGARHAYSIATSPRLFAELRSRQPSKATKDFIGFGDFTPRFDIGMSVYRRKPNPDCAEKEQELIEGSSALHFTKEELQSAQAHVGSGEVFLRERFTKKAVLATPLNDYRIVHFATHGIVPQSRECAGTNRPGLVASYTPGDTVTDMFLSSDDIAKRSALLDADIVILSACNTNPVVDDASSGAGVASGRREVGEYYSGLVKSFLSSGARAVMGSHWKVNDAASMALMTGFYEKASVPGTSYAKALLNARRALLDANDPALRNPRAWAPFEIVGDARAH